MNECKNCGIILTNENWYSSSKKRSHFICITCIKKENSISKILRHRRYKIEALNLCGGQCACCNENILDFLTIDHINNDGAADRKIGLKAKELHKFIIENKYDDLSKLRVLCFNCNISYGTYRVCPHNFSNDNKNICYMCNVQLINMKVGRFDIIAGEFKKLRNTFQNYHPFFKNSNINICINCSILLKNNIGKNVVKSRMNTLNKRFVALNGYGGKCECCAESRYMYLSIDHINGRTSDNLCGEKLYKYLINNNFPKDNYRILCYNCNCSRNFIITGVGGICPHKKENVIRIK